MNKLFKLLILSLALVIPSLASSATYGPNLLANYDFQQYPTVDNKGPDCGSGNGYDPNCVHPFYWREWVPAGWNGWIQFTHHGGYFLSDKGLFIKTISKGSGTSGVRAYYMYKIPVVAGNQYNWYFQTLSSAAGGRLLLAFYNSSGAIIQWQVPKTIPYTGAGFSWTTYSGNITVPAGAVSMLYAYDMPQVGVIYVDNNYFRTYTP